MKINRGESLLSDRPLSRRGFLKSASALSTALGANIVFANMLPRGLVPIALANSHMAFAIDGKPGLTILNDRPLNAETPAHLLNDDITPASRLFVRNNGLPPLNVDQNNWTLSIGGESVKTSKTYTLADLKGNFKNFTQALTLECGGNGRAEFYPPASGNQWTTGAVGCPEWNGIRLKDVLEDSGFKDDAIYIGYYSADRHLSQDPAKDAISRGVPMWKALEEESMIAWGMNGNPLLSHHGYPLRLVIGGWPGSTSGKWLNRIVIRNRVHDGAKMTGSSYRVPKYPVKAGPEVPDEDMEIIESMPVKSLITSPKSGLEIPLNQTLELHGHAWAGDLEVASLSISIDFGQTWIDAKLKKPANRHAWQNWDATVNFPKKGYYEAWARAVDSEGTSQPMLIPGWNPKGYLNNSCHRIAVYVV
ncbi:MAG: sulfite oxidase [Verrucomicrobia bacterium]|nr:sulfite oxidase [Verrucomicrobiota bacterium]